MRLHPRRKSIIFDGCLVVDQSGVPLWRTSKKNVDRYVKKGKAIIISKNPFTIKLLFTPNTCADKNFEYGLSIKNNVCCVCGKDTELSVHHIVPREYLKAMITRYRHHPDYLPICTECHEKYEEYARALKIELCKKYSISICDYIDPKRSTARKYASALSRYEKQLPMDKKKYFLEWLTNYLQKKPTKNDIYRIALSKAVTTVDRHSYMLLKKYKDEYSFIIMWRKHFIKTMKPKYMPNGWRVDLFHPDDFKGDKKE